MAVVENLIQPFVCMSTKEQFDFIRAVRQRRRTKPENPRKFKRNAKGKKAPKNKIKATKKLSPEAILLALSPEDKLKLLKEQGVI